MEHLVQSVIGALNSVGLSKEGVVFLISMLPLLELRGGILAASFLQVEYIRGALICLVGNIIPIPFILFFITPLFNKLKQLSCIRPTVEKLEQRAMSKSDSIQKYEFLGLMLFVGIPLPGTGAWTGALIAALLGVKLKKAVPAIFTGIILALCIMSLVGYGIPYIVSNFM
jgi:uncharacterized membrane protein